MCKPAGLSHVLSSLSQAMPRLRVGIGRPTGKTPVERHVLGRFSSEEKKVLESVLVQSVDLLLSQLSQEDSQQDSQPPSSPAGGRQAVQKRKETERSSSPAENSPASQCWSSKCLKNMNIYRASIFTETVFILCCELKDTHISTEQDNRWKRLTHSSWLSYNRSVTTKIVQMIKINGCYDLVLKQSCNSLCVLLKRLCFHNFFVSFLG